LTSLPYVDEWNKSRISLADHYIRELKHLDFIELPNFKSDGSHVYHLFCLATDYRDELIKHLARHNVQASIYYPLCIHLQKAYEDLNYKEGDFPIAERLSKRLLAIPLYPSLSPENQQKVITALKQFRMTHDD